MVLIKQLASIVTPGVDAVFTTLNTTNDWQMENVQLKYDICNLDNSLQNNYDSHLLSGKSLPINFNTYITQSQPISELSPVLNQSLLHFGRALTQMLHIKNGMISTILWITLQVLHTIQVMS